MGVKVLSLFDGMACGMLAMINANLKVDEYIAYEIDKYAVETATYNFPKIKECGNVFSGDYTKYKNFDYLIGGSPCVYWSISQSPDKRETTSSGFGWELFSQYVRALNESKPKFFIYENNVSMSIEIKKCISETFGFSPVEINSALVSAQSRKRLYWVGVLNDEGKYDKVYVPQPEDKQVVVRDILDETVNKQQNKQAYAYINNCVQVGALPRPNGELSTSQAFRIYDINGKSITVKAFGGGAGGKSGLYAIPVDLLEHLSNIEYTVYTVKNNYITIKEKQYPIKLSDGNYIIRKLTVNEVKRLQTVPDDYCFPVSNIQAYHMLGNGWTVDVISHIINATKLSETTKHLTNNELGEDVVKYINKVKSVPKKKLF